MALPTNKGDREIQRIVETTAVPGQPGVVVVNADGSTIASGGGGSGDGAILDGVSAAIKATVFDLTNSNPLTTALVDANGDQITSFGGGTQYDVDDVAGGTDTGTLSLVVRDDALTTLTPADGDYTQLRVGSTGALWTLAVQSGTWDINDISGTISLPTGAATAANQQTDALTDTELRATPVVVDLGANNDVTITSGTITTITNDVNIADGGNSITVDDGGASLTVDGTVTADTELPAAAALTDNFANPTAPAIGSFSMVWDGVTWDRLPGNATDGMLVNLGSNNDVTVTGSVDLDAAAKVKIWDGTTTAVVDTTTEALRTLIQNTTIEKTHGSVAGNLNLGNGGRYTVDPSGITVDDGDSAFFLTDDAGKQQITPAASDTVDGCNTLLDEDGDNSAQVCKASAGRLYGIEVFNINAADAFIQLFDVAAGSVIVGTTTPKRTILIPKGDATNYGGTAIEYPIPITFGTAITYACTTTPAGSGDPTIGLTVNLLYK